MAKKTTKRKKTVVQVSPEEERMYRLERLKNEQLWLCPPPERSYEIGESVTIGNLKNATVQEICEYGKIYGVSYTRDEKEGYNYWMWYDIRPAKEKRVDMSFIHNKDIRFSYSNTMLSGLLTKVFHFGVDMNPEYQRGFVWTKRDKIELIDSIFHNIDIGKFVFIERPYGTDDEPYDQNTPDYEILDGKQRLQTIVDFYLNRFKYNGCYYCELSNEDANWFTNYSVAVANCRNLTKEQKLQYFIMLNTTGRAVNKEHVDTVRNMLQKERRENG